MIIEKRPGHVRICIFVFWAVVFMWTGMTHAEIDTPYPPDIAKIKTRGRIIVAQYRGVQSGFFERAHGDVPANTPVYAAKGERLVGADITLASRIAEALGVKLEMDRTPPDFDSVCLRVARGKADIGISKLSATLKRAQYVRFTTPYAQLPICLMADRVFEAKENIVGRVIAYCKEQMPPIGIWRHSALRQYLKDIFPRSEAVPFDTFEDQVQALLHGTVHFVLDDELEVVRHLKMHPDLSLRLHTVTIPDHRDPIAIAVSCESPNLLAFLNVLIEQYHIRERVRKGLTSE